MSDPATTPVFPMPRPHIRRVPVDRAWSWLAAGWRDLLATPAQSLAWGFVPVVVGWAAVCLFLWFDLPYLLLPLTAGFFFVGPFLAGSFYEISRRRELGFPVNTGAVALAWKRNPEQIALMGALLLGFHLAWMRLAQLLFAVFEWRTVPSWDRFADLIWYSSRSLPFLAIGIAVGAALAAAAFVIGAFSIPYLLDRRDSNLFEGIATSLTAVRENKKAMLLWAGLIAFLVTIGMIPGLIGMVVVLPVVGHATWHAYRDVVVFEQE